MTQKVAFGEAQIEQHEELLLNLMDIRGRLMLVDPLSLTVDQHIEWNEQMYQVGLAITATEKAILTAIPEKYAQELPKIAAATERLERTLHRLKAANEVIAAVSAALGTIASIALLLA